MAHLVSPNTFLPNRSTFWLLFGKPFLGKNGSTFLNCPRYCRVPMQGRLWNFWKADSKHSLHKQHCVSCCTTHMQRVSCTPQTATGNGMPTRSGIDSIPAQHAKHTALQNSCTRLLAHYTAAAPGRCDAGCRSSHKIISLLNIASSPAPFTCPATASSARSEA